jgi:hypothetical protein
MTTAGVIYKLYQRNVDVIAEYIGFADNINAAREFHRNSLNLNSEYYNDYVHRYIRFTGNFDEWKFELLENIEYSSNVQLQKQLSRIVDKMKPELNKSVEFTTESEWNRHLNEYEQWYEAKMRRKMRRNRIVECSYCGLKTKQCNISNHKRTQHGIFRDEFVF